MLQKGGARLRDRAVSSFWDRVAWLYDLVERSNRAVNAAAAARAAELVPAGARVLDCAAGTGEFSLTAAERAGGGGGGGPAPPPPGGGAPKPPKKNGAQKYK